MKLFGGTELKYEESTRLKDRLYDGRLVSYCTSCWKAKEEGIATYKNSRDKHHV